MVKLRRALLGAVLAMTSIGVATVASQEAASATHGAGAQSSSSTAAAPVAARRSGDEPIPATPVPTPLPTDVPTPTPTALPCSTGTVTVANYNIKSGRGLRGALTQIAAQMATWSADVIILQEVDRNRAVTGKVDQAAWLGSQLGYQYAFGANVGYGGTAAYGTAILSRYPIISTANTPLPNLPGREQRGLLRATVDVNGTPLSFYSTHLQNKSHNAPLRTKQASTIVSLLATDPYPKVVGGDFNSAPNTAAMDVMRTATLDTWTTIGSGLGWTWPASRPRGRIDFMMYAGLTPTSATVLPVKLSDHLPILATYNYATAC